MGAHPPDGYPAGSRGAAACGPHTPAPTCGGYPSAGYPSNGWVAPPCIWIFLSSLATSGLFGKLLSAEDSSDEAHDTDGTTGRKGSLPGVWGPRLLRVGPNAQGPEELVPARGLRDVPGQRQGPLRLGAQQEGPLTPRRRDTQSFHHFGDALFGDALYLLTCFRTGTLLPEIVQ